jgi:hypothetical protein
MHLMDAFVGEFCSILLSFIVPAICSVLSGTYISKYQEPICATICLELFSCLEHNLFRMRKQSTVSTS